MQLTISGRSTDVDIVSSNGDAAPVTIYGRSVCKYIYRRSVLCSYYMQYTCIYIYIYHLKSQKKARTTEVAEMHIEKVAGKRGGGGGGGRGIMSP